MKSNTSENPFGTFHKNRSDIAEFLICRKRVFFRRYRKPSSVKGLPGDFIFAITYEMKAFRADGVPPEIDTFPNTIRCYVMHTARLTFSRRLLELSERRTTAIRINAPGSPRNIPSCQSRVRCDVLGNIVFVTSVGSSVPGRVSPGTVRGFAAEM